MLLLLEVMIRYMHVFKKIPPRTDMRTEEDADVCVFGMQASFMHVFWAQYLRPEPLDYGWHIIQINREATANTFGRVSSLAILVPFLMVCSW